MQSTDVIIEQWVFRSVVLRWVHYARSQLAGFDYRRQMPPR